MPPPRDPATTLRSLGRQFRSALLGALDREAAELGTTRGELLSAIRAAAVIRSAARPALRRPARRKRGADAR